MHPSGELDVPAPVVPAISTSLGDSAATAPSCTYGRAAMPMSWVVTGCQVAPS